MIWKYPEGKLKTGKDQVKDEPLLGWQMGAYTSLGFGCSHEDIGINNAVVDKESVTEGDT